MHIGGIYCQLGDYMLPTTLYKNLKNPMILTMAINHLLTLPETNVAPKIGRNPIGKDRIPTIHFQGRTISFREGTNWEDPPSILRFPT